MNKFNTLILTALLGLLASASVHAGKEIDESLDVTAGGKVRISVVRGEIEVKTWNQDKVHVKGEIDDATDEWIFETNGNETVIKVEVNDGYWGGKWNSSETDLVVMVPTASRMMSDGVSTDFNIDGVEGGIEINTVSGEVEVNNVSNKINVETISGDIQITNSWGRMKVSTISGDIDTDGKAEFFDAQSVSGDIKATIGQSEIVELTSVSGDIDLRFELMEDGRVDAETISGDLDLVFNNDPVNARFEINTGPGGDIRNEITNDRPESSFIGAEEIRFKSGNGSATVEISTMSGTVTLED